MRTRRGKAPSTNWALDEISGIQIHTPHVRIPERLVQHDAFFGRRPDLVPRVKMYLVKSRFSPAQHPRQYLLPMLDPRETSYFK